MKTKDWKADRKEENKCSFNWEDRFLAPSELLSHILYKHTRSKTRNVPHTRYATLDQHLAYQA